MTWTTRDALRQYNIPGWGAGYVDVGDHGQLLVRPTGEANAAGIDLLALALRIREAGLTWPVLVRFTDVLHSQVDRLCTAFQQAMQRHAVDSRYTATIMRHSRNHRRFRLTRFTLGHDSVFRPGREELVEMRCARGTQRCADQLVFAFEIGRVEIAAHELEA